MPGSLLIFPPRCCEDPRVYLINTDEIRASLSDLNLTRYDIRCRNPMCSDCAFKVYGPARTRSCTTLAHA